MTGGGGGEKRFCYYKSSGDRTCNGWENSCIPAGNDWES